MTARGSGASGGAGRVTSGKTTRGVRAGVGTGATGRQQLRDEPSGTALWVEELLQALEYPPFLAECPFLVRGTNN